MFNHLRLRATLFLIMLILLAPFTQRFAYAKTLVFSNITWQIRDGKGYPGPNHWSSKNVWVDDKGWLHLKITYKDGIWYCPGLYTDNHLGFGEYWFYTIGRLDRLDPNVSLAFFNYTTYDIGPDQTNEIDIEFSKWGSKSLDALDTSYTVWPTEIEKGRTSLTFKLNQTDTNSTHGFTWHRDQVIFQSSNGHYSDYKNLIASWIFKPPSYLDRIPQQPFPIYIYFYLVKGMPPKSKSKSIEIIIKKFCYKAEVDHKSNCGSSVSYT